MLRAVVDTNVLVSGTIQNSGHPSRIINAWRDGLFLLVSSPPILIEIERVLHYPKIKGKYNLSRKQISLVLENIRKYSMITPGKLELNLIQEDPDDNKFVQAALEGQAQYIVSGDLHLQKLRSYRDIRIVSPKEFVAKILSSSSGFRGC